MRICRSIDLLSVASVTMLAVSVSSGPAASQDPVLPPMQIQPTPQAVVDEHVEALNACDWNRIMAQYPDDVVFMLPGAVAVEGRGEIGKLFTGFCKARADGGFNGLTVIPEKVVAIGDTISVTWRMEADFLTEPYKGSDAYVTKDGLMQLQVTTFDPTDMKMK